MTMNLRQRLKSAFLGAVIGLLIPTLVLAQSATLLPNAKQQYLDDAGNPVANGQVFYYVPSTTTLKTVWQDAAETTPQANPVQLDAAGRPQPAGQTYGEGSYRQKVVDSLGLTIWDAVTTSTGTSSGTAVASTEGVMVGTVIMWLNPILPAKYLYTAGQAVSRTTYSDLYNAITTSAVILCQSGIATISVSTTISDIMPIGGPVEASCFAPGTTVLSKSSGVLTLSTNATTTASVTATFLPWGNGNGSTTFNIPDYRGILPVGRNNMSGANGTDLTSTYCGVNPNAINAKCGNEKTTLVTANLPPYTPAGIVSQPTANVSGSSAISAFNGSISSSVNPGAGLGVFTTGQFGALTITQPTFTGTPQGGTSTAFSRIAPSRTADFIIKALPDDSPTGPGVSSIQGMTGAIACGTGLLCTANTITVTVPAVTPSALTKVDDTNVTMTLGGTPAAALLQPTSLTLGWTGQLAVARGGTGVGTSTGSGSVVLNTSPTFATGTTINAGADNTTAFQINGAGNNARLTVGTTGASQVFLRGQNSFALNFGIGASDTMSLESAGLLSLGANATTLGQLKLYGNTGGNTTVQPAAAAFGTLTLPAATDTLMGKATTDTMTNKTFDSAGTGNTLQISGVTVSRGQYPGENSTGNATSGNIGEFVSSTVALGSAVALTSTTPTNITSISLTAGDWDVTGSINFTGSVSTTVTTQIGSFSTTSATLDTTDGRIISTFYNGNTIYNTINTRTSMPTTRFSLSGTTTVFFVAQSTFAVSTSNAFGIIRARRVR